ncbi:MAG: cytochrome-c peroxidase [Flavobacteriales bacterium]
MSLKTSGSLILVAILFFSSCKKDDSPTCEDTTSELDRKLLLAINSSTDGEGFSALMLPDSYDFSSIPQDPLNALTAVKVELGKLLFHETALGVNAKYENGIGTYSCASCHHAAAGFQANRKQGIGDGGSGFGIAGEGREPSDEYALDSLDVQPIRTPTAMNGAYQKVMLWNGQFGATGPNEGTEGQWTLGTPIWNNNFGHEGLEVQAIAGLSVHRMDCTPEMELELPEYGPMFDEAFPEVPEDLRMSKRFAGLAIGAYERTIMANQAPWQDYLRGNQSALTDSEKRGAELFFNKANCYQCHGGPSLANMQFDALGMADLNGPGIYGTAGAEATHRGRGGFTGNPEDDYKFKVPQLYNLKDSPFLGHGGNFPDVRSVIEYKNNAVPENDLVPSAQLSEHFVPLELTNEEVTDLTNFIENGLYDGDLFRYVPLELPSGNCIPNNDPVSQVDQGCVN